MWCLLGSHPVIGEGYSGMCIFHSNISVRCLPSLVFQGTTLMRQACKNTLYQTCGLEQTGGQSLSQHDCPRLLQVPFSVSSVKVRCSASLQCWNCKDLPEVSALIDNIFSRQAPLVCAPLCRHWVIAYRSLLELLYKLHWCPQGIRHHKGSYREEESRKYFYG